MKEQSALDQFDLRSRLRFNSDTGRIWLDEHRMVLMHTRAVGALRKELFDQVGEQKAQAMLWRAAFEGGKLDAEMALKMIDDAENYDVFQIGPSIHGLEGMVQSEIVQNDIDWEKGVFRGRVHFRNSWEAESHTQLFGEDYKRACWTITGYASGYVSRFLQSYVIFKETQCACNGHEYCVMEGLPADEWGDDPVVASLTGLADTDSDRFELEQELCGLRKTVFNGGVKRAPISTGNLVGESQGFMRAFDLLAKAAPSPITVMLLGETGVGKEVFARWLHEHSPRKDKPFIAVNCGAIPVELIESELFGVRKGAYTGADQSRPGRFERADGGTLFLDEVGDLPPAAQVKLLRAIQTGEVERLGDDQVRKVDVRIVSATNSNLKTAMQKGEFRQDLYYRLSTYPVEIPPLRERGNDITILAEAMIGKFSGPYGKEVTGLTDRAIRALKAHDWPGNVRELENTIERGILLAESGNAIEADHLFPSGLPVGSEGARLQSDGMLKKQNPLASTTPDWKSMIEDGFVLETLENQMVETAVAMSSGNISEAARLLGLTRRQLDYKLKNMEREKAEITQEGS
ncbi:sigma 54-interacting transcriptional regulator [Ponticaulis sp.]|uniref:sigma-54-dependent Fis family transcriptional regulator n=1 Tax=Ponticaulis sp. TaxID=2020902 RepID=UPI000B6D97CC|nr:sigma-54-dependent Fis family transcriptional regulator [Ponticaulis sp.]OUX98615.1 MAG: sigma-54-dependent Fis family transcriptional regulator [Hyphomonadaceae bacterium TMED5]